MSKHYAKKSAVVTLALLVSAGTVLAACGDSKDEAAPNNQTSPGAAASSGPKPKITVSIYDRNNVPEGEGTITNNRWTKWINENAPVQVEFVPVPRTNPQERWNVLFASNSAPDLIFEFGNNYMKELASKEQILPLDDIINKYSSTYKNLLAADSNLQKLTKFNGKTYFLGRYTPYTTNHYLMIRKDWLDKLNLQVPQTTEEFFQVAKAFVEQDPDGNGKKDTLGAIFHDVDYFFKLDMASNQADFMLKDDQYVHDWTRRTAAVAFKKRLYDAGLVDKDIFADTTGAKAQQDWLNGKLGIWGSGNLESNTGYGIYETLKKNNPNAEVVILPLPKSEFGQFAPAGGDYMQFTAAINATTKNPEAVMKYVDWLMSDEVQKTLAFGFEGEHYKLDANGLPKPIDAAKNKKELTWNADFYMLAQTGLMGKSMEFSNQLDATKALDKEFINLIDKAREAYLSPERPKTADVFLLPVSLPDDLLLVQTTVTNTLNNIYTKAIVGGSSYTVEQAMKDAQDAWDKAGGKKIDDFLAKAYTDNKKDVILTKDLYNFQKK
ncbi:extracellular solute-binding protein [Paenibacillus sp. YN15]|uniref:extracellular solute-binding protein n=1 Tax=Paenibacillus sp. YN15 TaxID=1742774 RepID=UPI000DCB1085|nr:extracellular solute-binding protein [Paenibacillus sp. YN15]RAU93299.1 ABC transporter substrate-binding protein [Paenibacillus sp. YN15]